MAEKQTKLLKTVPFDEEGKDEGDGKEDEEVRFVQSRLERLNVNQNKEIEEIKESKKNKGAKVANGWMIPDDDYYVHIDVLHNSSTLVSNRINTFMVRCDSFDPRRAFNFPTDLLEEGERDTLTNRRASVGIGSTYYEFWKVKRNVFRVENFRAMVEQLPRDTIVRLVRIIDNEHEITIWKSIL